MDKGRKKMLIVKVELHTYQNWAHFFVLCTIQNTLLNKKYNMKQINLENK